MPTNAELARLFYDMAEVLELTGGNPFRANAHAKVARIIENMSEDIATLADDVKALTAIEGIGDGSAKRIIEYCETGRIKEHDELVAKVPAGVIQIMNVPGVGPKTARLIWEKGGVTDIASLKAALDAGTLEDLPRLGKKLLDNIRKSIEFAEKAGKRTRIGIAMPLAEAIVEQLRRVASSKQVEYAGSLRRGRETIGDIDLLATGNAAKLSRAIQEMPGVVQVLAAGETKSSVRLESGIQVDLRVVEPGQFGAALMYFTGSKEHNIALRERAIKRGMTLNEYGLFRVKEGDAKAPQKRGAKPIAAKTEQDIYKALDLDYIAPELREDRGEIDAAEKHTLPELIELKDIKADLHAHTTASDGRFTIEQLAQEAKERGYHTIAITDHSKSSVQANGLSPDRLREHIEAIRAVAAKVKGVTLLAGSEVDIHVDGTLDYDDDLLAELDIVIASPHASLRQEPEKATKRLIAAIRHPLVHILGHPTGRMIGVREGLSPDIPKLVESAVEHDVALEINANYMRLDLRDSHVRTAVEGGALIAINTDAHGPEHLDFMRYGILTARRGWLGPQQCISTWSAAKLHKWLKAKR